MGSQRKGAIETLEHRSHLRKTNLSRDLSAISEHRVKCCAFRQLTVPLAFTRIWKNTKNKLQSVDLKVKGEHVQHFAHIF